MAIMISLTDPRCGSYFKYAKQEAKKSDLHIKVGACLVIGKSIIKGHNKKKTHTIFANPQIHLKTSLHAELACLVEGKNVKGSSIYVYRETKNGKPGLSKPCEHCMSFLREAGIQFVYYSVSEFPFWRKEIIC
jgi:deoxycytidylate deaminase